jgi:hypothetical protein
LQILCEATTGGSGRRADLRALLQQNSFGSAAGRFTRGTEAGWSTAYNDDIKGFYSISGIWDRH